ncbi:isochorismatase family cysteine hydrolase [Acuticoccus mangrovi]|uniref:Cysteine hydrolase n=1 Tax=Acuticoccus mangrovi TaxID=2796142 RepID=A0A934IU92_9HYPH|nr:isochorismatase family cysteine hydrolase [Acuticoccus mangrovi]MBJ3778703.1 cysteine hydrolase [Acuticoccus mangrovi]
MTATIVDLRHPSGINERIVAKVVARRGRLHAFPDIAPHRAALVVVDMMRASVEADPGCRTIVGPINALAAALRRAGGDVAWVTAAPAPRRDDRLVAIVGEARAALFAKAARPSDPRAALWHELDVRPGDIHAAKTGASAFFPGKCDLSDQLRERGIDTVLIAGTVTNVCCESSARDAVELGYRVVMVSDALAGHAHGLHEASLATFYRIFGDVRPTTDLLAMIAPLR